MADTSTSQTDGGRNDRQTREPVPQPKENDERERMQPRSKSKQTFRAGLFTLLGLMILIVGVFVIGGKKNLFSTTFTVHTNFQTVEGLKSGAPVMLNGIKIGTVSNVQLMLGDSSFVRVDMVLDEEYHNFVRKSTVATIAQAGFIGDKLITLDLGGTTAPVVADGEYIQSAPPPNLFAIVDEAKKVVVNAQNITGSLDTLFLRFRRGEGTLGKLLTDDGAYKGLVEVSTAAQRVLDLTGNNIAGISNTLGRAAINVDEMTVESKRLIADIGKGKGTMGALLYDRSLYDSLEVLAGTLNEAAEHAGFAAKEFGINMRGLRSNWLVGGLFGGGEDEKQIDLQARMLEIRAAELERQRQLLDEREKQLMNRERSN